MSSNHTSLGSSDTLATLVNPTDPYLEIVMEQPKKLLNTRLLVDKRPRFKLSTVDSQMNLTTIVDLDTKETVAVYRRRTFFSDTVTLSKRLGDKPVKKDTWLVPGRLPNGGPIWMMNSTSGSFVWRYDSTKRLVLTAENAPDLDVAYIANADTQLTLMVRREAESNLDEILLGFLILEHHLRVEGAAHKAQQEWGADGHLAAGNFDFLKFK